jgi:hypothetical protein
MAAETPRSGLLQDTLDMLILKVVALGPIHGYAIVQRLQLMSRDVLQIQQGSLYPALHRLESADGSALNGLPRRPDEKRDSTRSQGWAGSNWENSAPAGLASRPPSPASSAQRSRDMWFNRRRDPRIRDEIQFHRDRMIEDYMAAGISRADAERWGRGA